MMACHRLFLFAAVIFCSWSSYVCHDPWALSDNDNNCILLTFKGKLTVNYPKKDNSNGILDIDIRDATVAEGNKCTNKPQIALKWNRNLMTLTYFQNTTEQKYGVKSIEFTLPQDQFTDISPALLNNPIKVSTDEVMWLTDTGNSYRCDLEKNIQLKSTNGLTVTFTYSKFQHQAFMSNKKDKVFNTAKQQICSFGYANPWTWYDGPKSCILATFDGQLEVTYNDTEGKTVSRNFTIPKNQKAINGKCDDKEQSLTVVLEEAGSGMTLTYTKDETNKTYKLQKVEITLPETSLKNISPPLSTPVLLSFNGDKWSATEGKAYECDAPSVLKMKAENNIVTGVLTISKAKHEAFRANKDHTTFSESDKCSVTPIPTQDNSQSHASPARNTTPGKTTTPTADLGKPATPWNYTNQDSKVVCVIAEFDAQFNLLVNNVTKYVSVPLNAKVKEGSCDDACQWFKLEWMTNGSANSLKMSFKKKNTQYYLSELDVTLAPNNFVGTSLEKEVHLNYTGAEWNTDVGKSYLCNNTTDLSLKSDTNGIEGNITLSQNHVEAYRTSKEAKFSQNKGECVVEESSSNAAVTAVIVIVSLAVVGAGVYFGIRYWKK